MPPIPDSQFLTPYTLHLADTTLILSQRNSEWCGHGPILEQDIAITNISLDLIGQARNFYQYAASLINNQTIKQFNHPATEDSLAYLRTEREFKNLLLVEQPNGDWGQTILRQYLYSQFQYLLYQQLQNSKDEQLAAIAAKAIKETAYHLRWSSEWVIRLGDGTEESHARMLKAIDELWRYTGEMFLAASYELQAASEGIGVDISLLKDEWLKKVKAIFTEATLISSPVGGGWEGVFMQTGGKEGRHTEHLGFILTELQYIQRAYPNANW
jgi:ring-1,2-phenylacetyl-CoA epoxidase subunit PaaC